MRLTLCPPRDFVPNRSKSCFKILAALVFLFSVLLITPVRAADRELHVLTWSEYLEPALVSAFEESHNVILKFTYFESDDERTEVLARSDGKDFDLILVSGLDLARYVKRGWLSSLESAELVNRQHINPRWASAFPEAESYAVPYFWGSMGIAYRTDLVSGPITSWKQLLYPEQALHSRIMMNSYSRDLVGAALKALGHSINSNDRTHLKEAEALLAEQMAFVASYDYPSLDEASPLVTGDIWVSMLYSGDALVLQEYNENIAYVLPEEGGNLWVDYWSVAAAAREPQLATAFIDFLNEPSNAALNAEYVYYATPNSGAEALLPEDFFADPVIYPSEDNIARSEFYQPLKPRSQKLANTIIARVLNDHSLLSN